MIAYIIAAATRIAHGGAHGRPTGHLVPVPGRPGEWDYTTGGAHHGR